MRALLALIPDGRQTSLAPDLDKDNDWWRETVTELLDLPAKGRIRRMVAARFPLAEAARAHELPEHGGYAGKVFLVTGL
jgi:NADPH:quinone reductase-like Zn-dependent oxidoreductase